MLMPEKPGRLHKPKLTGLFPNLIPLCWLPQRSRFNCIIVRLNILNFHFTSSSIGIFRAQRALGFIHLHFEDERHVILANQGR